MIGLHVKIYALGRYGHESDRDYYFDGSLTDAIDLLRSYQHRQGDDWNQIGYNISNVRMLPEDIAVFAETFNMTDLNELESY